MSLVGSNGSDFRESNGSIRIQPWLIAFAIGPISEINVITTASRSVHCQSIMDDQSVVDGGEIPIGICAKLRGAADWKLWEHTFLAHAHLLGIQDYVTKGEPSMKVPIKPDLRNVKYDKIESAFALAMEVEGDPTIHEKMGGQWQLADLTLKSARQHAVDSDVFCAEMRQFSLYQPLLRKLARWIISTISPIHFSLCCKPNEDLHQWYMSLKRHFEDLLKNEIDMAILLLRQITEEDQPRTVEEAGQWVDKWEDAMDKAHMVGYHVPCYDWTAQIMRGVQLLDTYCTLGLRRAARERTYKHVASDVRLFLARKDDFYRGLVEDAVHRENAPHQRMGGRHNQRRGSGRY